MKKRIVSLMICGALVAVAGGCGKLSSDERVKLENAVDFVLELPESRDAVILQLTDIQIIDSEQQRYPGRLPYFAEEWKPENMDKLAFSHMRETVKRVKPDLIVLSGDNVYGEFDDKGTSLTALIKEMESYETPWTLTFGNHDNETRKGVAWTCEQYEKAEHCLFKRGPIESVHGNGNFNIGIVQGGKLSGVVWLMDSNGHTDSDSDQNMYSTQGLFPDQVEWFESRCEKLREYNGGKSPRSIGFFHHPLRAFGDGLKQYGYVSGRHDFYAADGAGDFKKIVVPENPYGDIGSMNKDAGSYIDLEYEFHGLLKKYGCEGWFFGHDHENNASVTFEGVRYTYGLKSSEYDSFISSVLGGTRITLGESGLKVCHEFVSPDKF